MDPRSVSSDGFMTNLQVVLLKLFDPVMDVNFSKVGWKDLYDMLIDTQLDKVDPEYFRNSKRITINEDTKIRATKEEAAAYFGKDKMEGEPSQMYDDLKARKVDQSPSPNFSSDLFFLLNSFQHLGLVKTIGTRGRAEKSITEMEKELKRMEASRGDWAGVRTFLVLLLLTNHSL